jgi:hypothetical protein
MREGNVEFGQVESKSLSAEEIHVCDHCHDFNNSIWDDRLAESITISGASFSRIAADDSDSCQFRR